MSAEALLDVVDRFNDLNDTYAIGFNFVVHASAQLQGIIQDAEVSGEVGQIADRLGEIDKMYALGLERMGAQADPRLRQFVARQRSLLADIAEVV